MTKKDWEKVEWARDLLGLGKKATLAQIKDAYRSMSKKHHPDLAKDDRKGEQVEMHDITKAYQVLLRFCEIYQFPLEMQKDSLEAEDWWLDRFGQDPLWGKQQADD